MATKSPRALIVFVALVACTIGVLGAIWHIKGPSMLSLSQPFIQAKLDSKIGADGFQLPPELLKKKHLNWLGVKDVTVQDIRLDLTGDQIGLIVTAQVIEMHTPYTVIAHTVGDLRYESGAFYFNPNQLALISVTSPNGDAGQNLSQHLDKAVDKLSQSRLLNRLGLADALVANKEPLIAFGEKAVQERVQKAAEIVLQTHPVYTFKDDWKGFVVRASLQSVEVKDFHIIAHVSFWQFTATVLLYAMMAFICLGLAVLFATSGAGSLFIFF